MLNNFKQKLRLFITKMEYLHLGPISKRKWTAFKSTLKSKINSPICKIFGHKWQYLYRHNLRICNRCYETQKILPVKKEAFEHFKNQYNKVIKAIKSNPLKNN